jgi:hypothetical protein
MSVRRLLPITALATAGALAVGCPIAAAHGKPATRPTHLTVHAAKGHVAPKRHDPFTMHLDNRHHGVAGEAANMSLWERTRTSSRHTSDWNNVTSDGTVTDNGDGSYTITGITPNDPQPKAGHKDQFEVRFAGDTGYRASRSSVITVVIKPSS